MKSLSRTKTLLNRALMIAITIAAIGVIGQQSASAQQLFLDFRFDAGASVGANTVTLTAGAAAQTFTVDVWATVVDAAQPNSATYGFSNIHFRGFSDIVSGTSGAVGTGTSVGPISAAQNSGNPTFFAGPGFLAADLTKPNGGTPTDLGVTTTSGASATTTTKDAINDFGSTLGGNNDFIISHSGYVLSTATNAGVLNGTGRTGFSFKIAQFLFDTGTAASTASETDFYPTQSLLATSQRTNYTVDGTTAVQTGYAIDTNSPLRFVVAGVVSGNDSVLNMTPATVSINSLAGGTNTTNLSVANMAADAATATGAFTGAFSGTSAGASQVITGSPVGTTPGQAAISYLAGAAPSATPVAFSYTITNTSNASDAQGAGANKTTAFTVNVGSATADNTGVNSVFGPALTATVANGLSYIGLESKVLTDPVAGAGKPAFPTLASSGSSAYTAGTADLAVILAGTNATANGGGTATVSMAWRTRTAQEAIGGPTVYSPSLLKPTTGLLSDIVNLTGVTTGTEAAGGITDPFALEMAFNPALTPKGGTLLSGLIANKLIYMVSLNSSTGLWDRATIDENFNNKVGMLDPSYGVHESFNAYLTAEFGAGTTPATVTAAQLNGVMGAWGVDTTTTAGVDMVWSVLNHNSQFAVVPEPSTLVLAAFGLMGLIGLRRRMKTSV